MRAANSTSRCPGSASGGCYLYHRAGDLAIDPEDAAARRLIVASKPDEPRAARFEMLRRNLEEIEQRIAYATPRSADQRDLDRLCDQVAAYRAAVEEARRVSAATRTAERELHGRHRAAGAEGLRGRGLPAFNSRLEELERRNFTATSTVRWTCEQVSLTTRCVVAVALASPHLRQIRNSRGMSSTAGDSPGEE